jgi:Mg-chelatase subunit ChlD
MRRISDNLSPNSARPGGLREPAPLRRPGRAPWWAALVAAALLAGIGWATWMVTHQPQQITDVVLTGHRAPVPLDVVLLLDESGSFAAYEAIRTEAITQLTEWAPANLRPDDTITVIAFTDTAVVRMPTMTVGALTSQQAELSYAESPGGGPSILPALQLATEITANRGSPRTVIAITDTLVSDANSNTSAELAAQLNAATMTTITPSGSEITRDWHDAFPWEHRVDADADSAGSTSLAIANALAHATGQSVERR